MELETILGIAMILIGVLAFAFVVNAKRKFPKDSELARITANLIPVLQFLVCFSLWHTVREAFRWKETYGAVAEYPEYFFISVAYVMLFLTARNLYKTAKRFGITK